MDNQISYTQIAHWDCGPTCLAWYIGSEPKNVRMIAKKIPTYSDGLDGYEMENVMDELGILYQPIIPSEVNKEFCANKTLLCMIFHQSPRFKGNHWIILDRSGKHDPLLGMVSQPLTSHSFIRVYLLERR